MKRIKLGLYIINIVFLLLETISLIEDLTSKGGTTTRDTLINIGIGVEGMLMAIVVGYSGHKLLQMEVDMYLLNVKIVSIIISLLTYCIIYITDAILQLKYNRHISDYLLDAIGEVGLVIYYIL